MWKSEETPLKKRHHERKYTSFFLFSFKFYFSASPLLKKWSDQAEKKVDEKPVDVDIDMTGEDKELAEAMNEEIAWAMQQKHEAQVAAGNVKKY